MTEAEAKTKWCPLSRVMEGFRGESIDGHSSYNRLSGNAAGLLIPAATLCIASACMAWEPEGYCGALNKTPGEKATPAKPTKP